MPDELDLHAVFSELDKDAGETVSRSVLDTVVEARTNGDTDTDEVVSRAVEEGLLRDGEGRSYTVTETAVGDPGHAVEPDESARTNGEKTGDATGSSGEIGTKEKYSAVPDELKERDIWLLWDSSADTPKQPHWYGNRSISWSNPDDWHSFEEAVEAAERRDSWGIGYVNALDNDDAPREVLCTIDIDGARDGSGDQKDWLPPMDVFVENDAYIELSPSGTGYHVPLVGYEPPEWWSDIEDDDEHEGVEVLTNKFCTVTGNKIPGSGDRVAAVDATEWLEDVHANLTGDIPSETVEEDESYAETDDDGLTEQQAEEALENIDPDVDYGTWRNIGFALVSEFGSGRTAERLFKDWSKGGNKWDDEAEDYAKRITNDAHAHGGVSGATLVYHAKQGGWEPDFGGGTERPNDPEPGEDSSDGLDTPDNWVSKAGVKHAASLSEDDSISDLTDREKAACIWELIKKSEKYHVRVRRDNSTLWAYDDGIWTKEGERTIRRAARDAVGAMNYGENVVNEVKTQARGDPEAEVEPDEFGVEPGKVAVRNGLLDLDAAAEGDGYDAVRELRPSDYALVRLPVDYDPKVDFDRWGELVSEWAEPGRADALQEFVGYCLEVGRIPIHRALMLVGGGANGKSTFLHVVRALLGEDNITSTELQTLANERDAVAQFYGAIANIDDDLSSRKLGKGVGMFKKMVAGDEVRGRHLYEEGFEFTPTGKHLYAANKVPEVENIDDGDEAFWRRWLLVEFPKHYPRGERDKELPEKLTTDEALTGVLNWAIEGRRRLLNQGHFSGEYESAFEKRDRWKSWGEAVDEFINDHVETDEDADNVSTGYAYERFQAWAKENDKDTVGQQKFTETLRDADIDVGYDRSVRVDGTVTGGYRKLGFSDDVPEAGEDQRADGQEGFDEFDE